MFFYLAPARCAQAATWQVKSQKNELVLRPPAADALAAVCQRVDRLCFAFDAARDLEAAHQDTRRAIFRLLGLAW